MVSNQESDYVYTKRCRRRIDGLHHLQCDIVCLLAIGRVLTPRDGVSGSLHLWGYNEPLTPSRGVIVIVIDTRVGPYFHSHPSSAQSAASLVPYPSTHIYSHSALS